MPTVGASRIRIHGLAHGGAGVGRTVAEGGPTWFVAGGLPGELVEARVRHRAPRYVHADLTQVLESSGDRVAPPCPLVGTCGGCAWQHVDTTAQPELKRRIAAEQLRRVVPLDAVRVAPLGGALGYRRRARLHAQRRDGVFSLGLRRSRSRDVADVPHCPVLDPALDAGLQRLRAVAPVLPDDAEVLGLTDGQRVIVGLPGVRPATETIATLERVIDDVLVGVEVRAGRRSAVVGRRHLAIDGHGDLPPIHASAFVFVQPHPDGGRALVRHVAQRAAVDGLRVLELFAGAGNFTRALARHATRVWASDTDREAIEFLRGLAKAHGLSVNAKRQSASGLLERLAARGTEYDVAVLDPPRGGLGEAPSRALCQVARQRIVYVSCDPSTLARDLTVMTRRGFAVRDVTVFDLMPMTPEIELVAVLERGSAT